MVMIAAASAGRRQEATNAAMMSPVPKSTSMTGRNLHIKSNLFLQALRIGPAEREEIRHREFVERIIDFLEIQPYRKTPVGRLPYGLQKRVDLGRALALEPSVLLLDEPMSRASFAVSSCT